MKGTVINYNSGREFGYLIDEKKDEYCFYSDDIQFEKGNLKKGDKVFFDIYSGHGLRAVNIRRN